MTETLDIRLIAAVGRRGQLGLNGRMPWHDGDDLRFFRQATSGGVLLVGYRTYEQMMGLHGTHGRELFVDNSREKGPEEVLRDIASRPWFEPLRTIWVCGGSATYWRFMPYVRRFVVCRVDYDGPADAWMPPMPWEVEDGTDYGVGRRG